jgi:hypothetical protein
MASQIRFHRAWGDRDRHRQRRLEHVCPSELHAVRFASRREGQTISTLAHMARFVIADLTDAKSVLQELQAVVPLSPSVVVQPLLMGAQEEPGMLDFIRKFPWVLDTPSPHEPNATFGGVERTGNRPCGSEGKRADASERPGPGLKSKLFSSVVGRRGCRNFPGLYISPRQPLRREGKDMAPETPPL